MKLEIISCIDIYIVSPFVGSIYMKLPSSGRIGGFIRKLQERAEKAFSVFDTDHRWKSDDGNAPHSPKLDPAQFDFKSVFCVKFPG